MGDKNVVELITCDSGGWEVLKLNGNIIEEAHSIPNYVWLELLSMLDVESKEVCISDEEMERGMY